MYWVRCCENFPASRCCCHKLDSTAGAAWQHHHRTSCSSLPPLSWPARWQRTRILEPGAHWKAFKNSNRLWKHHTCQIQITFAHKCTGFIFARLASSNYRGKVHICSQVVWNNHKKGPSATVLAKGRYFVLASQTKMTAVCNCIIVIFFYGFCGFYRSACLWLHNNFIMHKSSFKISLGFLNRQGTVVLSRCYYTTS